MHIRGARCFDGSEKALTVEKTPGVPKENS